MNRKTKLLAYFSCNMFYSRCCCCFDIQTVLTGILVTHNLFYQPSQESSEVQLGRQKVVTDWRKLYGPSEKVICPFTAGMRVQKECRLFNQCAWRSPHENAFTHQTCVPASFFFFEWVSSFNTSGVCQRIKALKIEANWLLLSHSKMAQTRVITPLLAYRHWIILPWF